MNNWRNRRRENEVKEIFEEIIVEDLLNLLKKLIQRVKK